MARDRLKASGQLGLQGLRTQALVEFGFNAEDIPRLAPANHHVLVPGDHADAIKDVGYVLGRASQSTFLRSRSRKSRKDRERLQT